MADTSKIEWTDATWNVVTGCDKVSPGCDNCYAETFAERWRGTPGHHFETGFDVTLRPERLTIPLKWRKPKRVFVNSMSDLFHKGIPDEYIAQVFAIMALTPQHTYQVLTKRHARMRTLLSDRTFLARVDHDRERFQPGCGDFAWPLPNVWLGVSVENQKWADIRIPALLGTPAAVRFLSCEPLLGPVKLPFFEEVDDCTCGFGPPDFPHSPDCGLTPGPAWGNLHWVIAGGESGRKARPMHPQWATSLRDQCAAANVPFFFKQWGEYAPTGYLVIGGTSKGVLLVGDPVDDLGHRVELARVGKAKAGRELDGRTWDQFPRTA
ncbi:DUF5131 family protein (plasmid) [Streptomyces sp. GDS52]|uniref:DUF5131 family protein n=1 Tax=Streptomyces sp. GDS52 TaxID=3406419 RepID=UPI003FD0C674